MNKIILLNIVILSITSSVMCGSFYTQWYPLADEIISHMTLDQKIGQTIQTDVMQFNFRLKTTTDWSQIKEYQLGSVLVGGNGCPDGKGSFFTQTNYDQATLQNWQEVADIMIKQTVDVSTPSGEVNIKLLLGTDAVHGNQHVLGEILFPHNIGCAATHNVQNFANSAYWNQKSVKASGFNFIFAPTVAISHNPQWGRFYETLGDDPIMVEKYAYAYVKALQQIQGKYLKGAVASTKHFLGDGATKNGNDEGNGTFYNMKKFLDVNLAGYRGALKANTGTIMVSYSATNNIPMSVYGTLLQNLLKDTLGYDGLLISDYDAVGKVAIQGAPTTTTKMTLKQAYNKVLNSGMDMIMQAPSSEAEVLTYINYAKDLLNEKTLDISRLNDMVRRILAVKLAMQLVVVPDSMAQQYQYDNPQKQQEYVKYTAQEKEREYDEALQAAQESLVLLKNQDKLLPLTASKLKYIVLMGEKYVNNTLYVSYDNIGIQNGGWSVRWQGYEGNHYWSDQNKEMSFASSILDGLNGLLGNDVQILKPDYADLNDLTDINKKRDDFIARIKQISDMNSQNTVIIGAFGESGYAEFMGEINSQYCKGTTNFVEGCLYNQHLNEYLPLQQKTDLVIGYDDFSLRILDTLKSLNIKLVSVLFSGRPMIVDQTIAQSNAFVVAWWPGTAGGVAITNALFGQYRFKSNGVSNRLPLAWVHQMKDLEEFPIYIGPDQPRLTSSTYPSGFGLAYD